MLASTISDQLRRNIDALRQRGFRLSIDDFGAGYTSVQQIIEYTADTIKLDRALVSTARRTRQTWEAIAASAGLSVEAELDGGLFAGGPETVHDLIRHTPDDHSSLMVIGHNPTMAYLAQLLDDGEGGVDAVAAMSGGFPPCAMAVFSVPDSWSSLDVGGARLVAFHVGRAD